MYKAVIIEDEHKLREALFLLLQHTVPEKVNVIGVAETVATAVQLIEALKPNLVFMDIQLKDGTAFEVLKLCQYKNFHLIFTTAYQQHALLAFKYSAIDYLLKPIDPEELKNAVNKIEVIQQNFSTAAEINVLQQALQTTPTRITLSTQQGRHIVALADIIRCETSGSYTTFYLVGNKKIMVSKSLKNYDELLLPPQFFRIHQSHTVNISFVSTYLKEGFLLLKDNTQLPVAQRKKEEFLRLINQ